MTFRRLTPDVQVSPQISLDEVAVAAASGVTRIVNNRPDGEDPGQPPSAQIEAAARAAGLDYLHVPITGMPNPDQIAAVGAALAEGGSVLMYCRSGTRSTTAWALATAASGALSADDIRAAGTAAGYDLSRLAL